GAAPEMPRLGHAYQDTRRPRQSVPENEEAARRRPLDPRRRLGLPLVSRSPALDGRLESTAGRELRNGCCRDVHLLARVARVDACPSRAIRGRELPEPRERDLTSALQRVRDGLEKRVDGLARVAARQLRAPGDLGYKLLLRHSLLQS